MDGSQLYALEAFALSDRQHALSSSMWAPGSAEQAFYTGLHALHNGDLQSAQQQVDALQHIRYHDELFQELQLRLQLAKWDLTAGDDLSKADVMEHVRLAAGITFDELEVADGDDSEVPSDEQQALPSQLLSEQVGSDQFLNDALAAGLASGSPLLTAGQQTDFNRMLLFAMDKQPSAARCTSDAEQWQRCRWQMLRATQNPAALPGVVAFIASCLADKALAVSMSEVPLDKLTLQQLHQLADAWPAAKSSNHWVAAAVLKMYPQQPAEITHRRSFLDRVQQFCDSLPLEGSWLRVQLLQARLQLAEETDTVEAEAFIDYVRRSDHIVRYARSSSRSATLSQQQNAETDAHNSYGSARWAGNLLDIYTGGDLQRFEMHHMSRIITHHLASGDLDTIRSQWQDLFDPEYEACMVAEASLLAGVGDVAEHARRLAHEGARICFTDVQQLQDRVELAYAPSNPKHVKPADPVTLQLDIKNVPSLLLKVYEINTRTYYTINKSELPIDIQLEGLGATSEQSVEFVHCPAMLRHRESIPLDCLQDKRGTFVIEVVGGGVKSRAVIWKGSLHHVARVSAAGTAVTIFDADMRALTDGRIWVNGEEYPVSAASGEAVIPFAASGSGPQPVVLIAADDFAALATLHLQSESYSLTAGFWADREALQPGGLAPLLLWAALQGPDGGTLPVQLLQNVELVVVFTDHDGVDSRQSFRDIKLNGAGQASAFDIRLPERCAVVAAELTAKVELLAPGGERFQTLQQAHRWEVNDTHSGSMIGDVHLRCKPDGSYVLQTLGRCGEAIQKQTVAVQLQHIVAPGFSRDFRLQSDADGNIALGKLSGGISSVVAKLASGTEREWLLPFVQPSLPSALTIVADSAAEATVDYVCSATSAATLRSEGVQLLQQAAPCGSHSARQHYGHLQSGGAVSDLADCLGITHDGRLTMRNVPEGAHKLYLPRLRQCIDILAFKRHPAGELQRGPASLLLGKQVAAAKSVQDPLRVVKVTASSLQGIHVHLAGAAAGAACITISLSRFVSAAANEKLSDGAAAVTPATPQQQQVFPPQPTAYSSGKRLSEETRYCLERRRLEQQGKIRTGNQCMKPSLLVHPWAVRKTSAEERQTEAGEDHRADRGLGTALKSYAAPPGAAGCFGARQMGSRGALTAPRLGFCIPPALLSNLKVGAGGKLELSAAALQQRGVDLAAGGFTAISIVAVTPAGEVASKFGAVDASANPAPTRDQGLVRALAEQSCCIQVSAAEILMPGATLRITDATSSRVNLCDDASKLWSLYGTMLAAKGEEQEFWRAFDFLPQWGMLSRAEKVARLRDYACHELHFFVQQRDPELFQAVVLPLLQNKLDSELGPMDLWLLGRKQELVALHGHPAAFALLNALERCLVAAAAGATGQLAVDMAARCRHALRDRHSAAQARKRFDIALQAADPDEEGGMGAQLESWKQGAARGGPPLPPAPMAAMSLLGAAAGGGGPGIFGGAGPLPLPRSAPQSRHRAAAHASAPACDDYHENEEDDGAEGWELSWCPDEGSGADTDMGFELLSNGEHDDQSSDSSHDSDDPDLALRQKQQQQHRAYQPPEPTQEWQETGYWKRRRVSQLPAAPSLFGQPASRVPESLFWADYAAHLDAGGTGPFLSRHLAHAGHSFTDAVAAVAVTGVSFTGPAEGHTVTSSAGGITITAAAPAVAFHRQVQAVEDADAAAGVASAGASVSVVRRLYDAVDRYVEDEATGEQVERTVSGPLRVGSLYGYHIIVSSTSAVPLALDVLAQVPQGSLPLEQKPFAWCSRINVAPYTSSTLDLPFYFPHPSDSPSSYNQFPVTVSRDSRMLAASDAGLALAVEHRPAAASATAAGFDWGSFSRTASDEEVLQYLREGDLARAHLPALQRRCRRHAFFVAAVAALRARLAWCPELWRFALLHKDQRALQELLPTLGPLLSKLTPPVDTTLLRVPVQEHKEFWPLVGRRAHALGGRPTVEDGGLRGAWAELLGSLARQPTPPPAEKLKAAVFLLAQDRIDEAEALVAELRAQPDSLPAMQMDYLNAWLALAAPPAQLDIAAAAAAVQKHSGTADKHWAARWAQLKEAITGVHTSIQAGNEAGEASAEQQLPSLAVTSGPAPGQVTLRHHGLPAATVAVYEMDVELLFSAQPFGQTLGSGGVRRGGVNPAYVQPRAAAGVQLSEAQEETVVTLANLFSGLSTGGSSLLVEARAEGVPPATASCYSAGLRVRVTPRAGLLQASRPVDADNTERQPAVATYVKVFARRGGSRAAVFHKDGYTDVRGMFDYVSTTSGRPSTTAGGSIDRFAILVTHQHWGAVIEEAQPPHTLH